MTGQGGDVEGATWAKRIGTNLKYSSMVINIYQNDNWTPHLWPYSTKKRLS